MIISIAACGESGSEWYKTPCDYSIGVNDCQKWNHPVNELLLINQPKSFTPSRLETIKSTKFDKVLTHSGTWDKIFPQAERIRMQSFSKHLVKGRVYSSKTSPFVAASLAFNMGATDIILHGCDLLDHPAIKDKLLNYELRNFDKITCMMADQGCKVWLGKNYGALTNFLPVWKPLNQLVIEAAERNFPAFKEALTQVILKQAQDDFEALGYKRTGDDRHITSNGLYKVKGDKLS